MRVPISEFIYRTGLDKAIGWRFRGRGVIFMLHSITDDPSIYLNDPLRCTPSVLEATLRWSRKRKLDIVTLDEASHRLRSGSGRPFAVFTFDDGYRDNITRALPLMARYEAPMTIYVTTGMITRELFAWWDGVVELFRRHDEIDLEAMEHRFSTHDLPTKARAASAVKKWVHADGGRAQDLRQTFNRYGIDIEALLERDGMNLRELRQTRQSPLLTIAAHTVTHPFLTRQTAADVRREMIENKRFLEDEIEAPVRHFSYPFGDAGPREAAIAADVGFFTATSTQAGTLHPQHATEELWHELPREPIDHYDTAGCLECKLQGVYRFLRTRSTDPVARLRRPPGYEAPHVA